MALTRKSSTPVQRIEGEYPELPDGNELGLDSWWLDTRGVLNRVRDNIDDVEEDLGSKISASNIKALYESNSNTNSFTDYFKDRLENLEDALGIDGAAMGTGNVQEVDNKILGGGSF